MNNLFDQGDPRAPRHAQHQWFNQGNEYGDGYPPYPYQQRQQNIPAPYNAREVNRNQGSLRTPIQDKLLKIVVGAVLLGVAILLVVTLVGFVSDLLDFFSIEALRGIKRWYRGLSDTAKVCFFASVFIAVIVFLKHKL